MTLRSRLWLVLAGLFMVPLVVGALVLLLVVPGARSDRTDQDVTEASAGVRAELVDECAQMGLVAKAAALQAQVATPAPAAHDPVDRDGVADYVAHHLSKEDPYL